MSGVEIPSESPEETFRIGRALGSLLRPGDCVALVGELGAGKTALTKGIAAGLGVADQVVSPSFNLLLEYPGKIPLRHLDAYFSSREAALLDEAQGEIFGEDGVAVVEWAEKIAAYLPASRVEVTIEIVAPERRRLVFAARGQGAQERLSRLRAIL